MPDTRDQEATNPSRATLGSSGPYEPHLCFSHGDPEERSARFPRGLGNVPVAGHLRVSRGECKTDHHAVYCKLFPVVESHLISSFYGQCWSAARLQLGQRTVLSASFISIPTQTLVRIDSFTTSKSRTQRQLCGVKTKTDRSIPKNKT